MQVDLAIYRFSRLTPKARPFFRALTLPLSPLALTSKKKIAMVPYRSVQGTRYGIISVYMLTALTHSIHSYRRQHLVVRHILA